VNDKRLTCDQKLAEAIQLKLPQWTTSKECTLRKIIE